MNGSGISRCERHQRLFSQLAQAEVVRERHERRALILTWCARIGILIAFIAFWELLTRSGTIDTLLFSSPSAILSFLESDIGSGAVWPHLLVTLRETLLAFVIGSSLGLAFGLLRINFPLLARISDPFLTMLNALPRVALAPTFIIWFGIGEPSKVGLAISLVFFILMINTESGAKGIEQEYFTVMRAMGATRYQLFRMVVLPGSVAAVFGGLRLAVVYSMTGVVFGEMLAARAGLGQQLQYYASTFRTDGVFGTLLILALVAIVINSVIAGVEGRLLGWRA